MLFVQPQDVVFQLKLYEIGCMMHNFTPDVHGEVHIWHQDTMQRSTDGPKTCWMDSSELASSSIHRWVSYMPSTGLSSEMCLEAVWSGWTSKAHCPASAARWWFPDVLGWHYVGPTYATGGHGRRWNGNTIQEWHPSTNSAQYRQNFGRNSS